MGLMGPCNAVCWDVTASSGPLHPSLRRPFPLGPPLSILGPRGRVGPLAEELDRNRPARSAILQLCQPGARPVKIARRLRTMGGKRHWAEAWRRYAEREGLVSAMNATKWLEATEAMRHLDGGSPSFRIKDIQGPEPGPAAWDREWFYHPRPWETIEWLEIDRDPRHDEIVAILKGFGVPISLEEGRIRIWGWLRPGMSPEFAWPSGRQLRPG